LRAEAKLSTHAKSKTRAPSDDAASLMRSVEPVSTTIISWTSSAAERRQDGLSCSFLTIRQSEMGTDIKISFAPRPRARGHGHRSHWFADARSAKILELCCYPSLF
jgi:hypothetical protein